MFKKKPRTALNQIKILSLRHSIIFLLMSVQILHLKYRKEKDLLKHI